MITIDRLEKYLRSRDYSLETNSGTFQYWKSNKWHPVIVRLLEDRAQVWILTEQDLIEEHITQVGF